MKKKDKLLIYIINILLVLLVFYLFMLTKKIYPFGNQALATSDGLAQFQPMLYDFVMKLKYGLLETYSFNNSLGNPTIFNLLYYITTPLNLLLVVFKDANIMYLFAIVIKIILTSIFMTFYVSHKTNNKLIIIISSLSYSFCSWFLIYFYYLSFVDVYMIFPLFQYGLEKVLDGKKSYSYIFSLWYMIICNFYLSFSVCIYTIIYFIIYIFIYKKTTLNEKKKLFFNIAKQTIICALLSFFWIYALADSYSRMNLTFDQDGGGKYYVYLTDLIGSLYHGYHTLTVSGGEKSFPNISCPFWIFLGVVYFFISRNVDNKKKLIGIIGVFLVLLAVFFPPFDFLLNMFHTIRGLTFRYSFIICFFEIIMFIESFKNINMKSSETKKGLIISLLFMSVFNVYNYYYFSTQLLFVVGVSFIIMFIIILLYQNNKIFKILILLLLLTQSFLSLSISKNAFFTHVDYDVKYKMVSEKYRNQSLYEYCPKKYGNNISEMIDNCNLYDNTKSIHILSSMSYNNVIYDMRKLGVNTYVNTYLSDETNSKVLDMIFNLKNDKYYLEKIYSVKKNIKKVKLAKDNVVYSQVELVKGLSGYDNIFDKNEIKATYKYLKNFYDINLNNYIIEYKDPIGNNHSYIGHEEEMYLNRNLFNETINIYTYNEDKLKEVYDYLSKNQIQYTYYSDSKIEGTINVDKDQMIFTSIPYDTNWNIYIDGKKVKAIKLLDSLIGIETTPGKHTIKMEYKYHLLIPALISLVTFLGLIISIIRNKKLSNDKL